MLVLTLWLLSAVGFAEDASPQRNDDACARVKDNMLLQTRTRANKVDAKGIGDFFDELKNVALVSLNDLKDKTGDLAGEKYFSRFEDKVKKEMDSCKDKCAGKTDQKMAKIHKVIDDLKEKAGLEDEDVAEGKEKLKGLVSEGQEETSKYDWRKDDGDKIEELQKNLDRSYPRFEEPLDALAKKALAALQAQAPDEKAKEDAKQEVEKITKKAKVAFTNAVRTAIGFKLKAKRRLSGRAEDLMKKIMQGAEAKGVEETAKVAVDEFKEKLAVHRESSSEHAKDSGED